MQLRVHSNVRQVLTLELRKRSLFAVVRFHVQALLSRLTHGLSHAPSRSPGPLRRQTVCKLAKRDFQVMLQASEPVEIAL